MGQGNGFLLFRGRGWFVCTLVYHHALSYYYLVLLLLFKKK